MEVITTKIADVKIIQPKVFGDARGFFLETFEKRRYQQLLDIDLDFVQDNYSRSARNVLRGLHFQKTQPQGKLVRVVQGAAFDVAVDIRKGSPTFGQWVGVELNADNRRQLWIPEGFAHGFVALEDDTHFLYKTTDTYSKEHERSIRWDDADIGIDWPLNGMTPLLTQKDAQAPVLQHADTF